MGKDSKIKITILLILQIVMIIFSITSVEAATTDSLKNKKVLFDGDSIAYGAQNATERDKCGTTKCPNGRYSYANYIATNYNMIMDNVAVSGTGFIREYEGSDGYRDKFINHLTTVQKNTYDYVILEGGTNDIRYYPDYNGNYTIEMHTTAIREYLNKVISNWPTAKIGFIIIPKVYSESQTWRSQYASKYFGMVKNILNELNIPYIDFLEDSKYSSVLNLNDSTYSYDKLHPTVAGHEKWAPYIANFMSTLEQYKFTVNYDANGGTTSTGNIKKNYNEKIGTLPTPTRKGYVFEGWYTTKNSGGDKITSNTLVTKNVTYYARWSIKPVRVYYNSNGGEISGNFNLSNDWVVKSDGSEYYQLFGEDGTTASGLANYNNANGINISKNHYIGKSGFEWNTNNKGTGTSFNQAEVISYNNLVNASQSEEDQYYRLNLYVNWESVTYTITFNGNGGSPTTQTREREYEEVLGALPTVNWAGHNFLGWYTAKTEGDKISANTPVTKNVTYYARWELKPVRVYYNSNGGEISGNFNLSNDWVVKSDGSEYYQLFGEDGTTASGLANYNNANGINISKNHYIGKSGFEWNTNNKGTGTSFNQAEVISYNNLVNASQSEENQYYRLNLYVNWESVTYTITFNGNGGSPTTQTREREYEEVLGALPTVNRTGYNFLGWYDSQTGGTLVLENTKVTGNKTYWAHWEKKSYIVTFNGNGGMPNTQEITKKYEEVLGILPIVSKPGYNFLGWYTDLNNGTLIYANTPVTKNATYYAHWELKPVRICYHPNGGTVSSANGYGVNGSGYVTQNGSDFCYCVYDSVSAGKSDKNFCSGKYAGGTKDLSNYNNSEALSISKPGYRGAPGAEWQNISYKGKTLNQETIYSYSQLKEKANPEDTSKTFLTLYVGVNWEKESYTVTFNGNGGMPNTQEITKKYEEVLGILPIVSKPGYNFLGWYTDLNNGTLIYANTPVTKNATYYAHWELKPIRICYHPNGGRLTEKAISNGYAIDKTMGLITKDGKLDCTILKNQEKTKLKNVEFIDKIGYMALPNAEWYKDNEITKTLNQANEYAYEEIRDILTISDELADIYILNLKINWKKSLDITFNPNGGDIEQLYQKVLIGTKVGELPKPQRDGYQFLGWYDSQTGGKKIMDNFIITQNLTLFAHWERCPNGTKEIEGMCVTHSCENINNVYYNKYGQQVNKLGYEISCVIHKCEILGDNIYFDNLGNKVSKEDYQKRCPNIEENPNTGAFISYISIFLLSLSGAFIYFKTYKKNKFVNYFNK